ncbi:MAG: hypothetical protein Q9180_007449, partial [Flavoplaca navasiana]
THYEWQLIKQAALASALAYDEAPDMIDGQHFKAKGNCKAMIMYIDEVDNRKILTIAVRGTVTKGDWMLNVNSSPKKSSKVSQSRLGWKTLLLMKAKDAPENSYVAWGFPSGRGSYGEASRQSHLRSTQRA